MFTDLDQDLDTLPGTVSVWFGGMDGISRYVRLADVTHYAASTMKVAVMAAAYRMADEGKIDVGEQVQIHNEFTSASGTETFANDPEYDNDPEPWHHLGGTMPLRWLIRHMITRSSNLSTNLVLERIGLAPVRDVWAASGAKYSVTTRGIEDYAANRAGRSNLVTAADLAALLLTIANAGIASREASAEMLDILRAQEANEPFTRALPNAAKTASKSGWVDGIRHSMAIVTPPDAPEFVLTTCVSADEAPDETLSDVITRVTQAAWAARHVTTAG